MVLARARRFLIGIDKAIMGPWWRHGSTVVKDWSNFQHGSSQLCSHGNSAASTHAETGTPPDLPSIQLQPIRPTQSDSLTTRPTN